MNMISMASGRQIMSGVCGLRCFRYLTRASHYSTKAQLQLHSPVSFVILPWRHISNSRRLLHIMPVNWHGSRFYSSDSHGKAPSDDKKTGLRLSALMKAPRPALFLGFSGLIPFISAPVLMVAMQSFYPEVAHAQMLYGASIVSFLGGARWGFALPDGSPARPDWMNLGNSVVPSLVAWLALLCRDNIAEGALIVIMGLGLSLHYDLNLLPGYPPWFKAMRTVLTLVATFSLVATLVLKQFLTEKKFADLKQVNGKAV